MITFPYLCKKELTMATTVTRVQTAFRLPPELLARVKYHARRENLSVNSYVERVLDRATALVFPFLPEDTKIDDDILAFAGKVHLRPFTKEELDADPKLAYLVEKYGL